MIKKVLPQLEFSRPLQVDRVPRKGSHEFVKAEPQELLALAKRFSLSQLHSFGARLLATPWRGGGLKVTGTVEADLDRVSVVSLEPFRRLEKFEVERYFLPPGSVNEEAEDDADPIAGGHVDLGEIAAEAMGLELDPYPRLEGEVFETEPETSPKN